MMSLKVICFFFNFCRGTHQLCCPDNEGEFCLKIEQKSIFLPGVRESVLQLQVSNCARGGTVRNTLVEHRHGVVYSAKVLLLHWKGKGRKKKGSLYIGFSFASLPPTFLPILFLYWNRFVRRGNFVNFLIGASCSCI